MSLFRKAENEVGAFKGLFYGGPSTGKSYSVAKVMAGRARSAFGPGAKVAWLDSGENGADPLIPIFEAAEVELLITRTRRYDDALAAIGTPHEPGEAQRAGAVGLVVDQFTDLWRERLSDWRRGRVEIPQSERDAIGDDMRELNDRVKACPLDTIIIGRAKDDYEGGVKIGRKLDADNGAAFASSLTVYMERVAISKHMSNRERALLVACPRCESGPGDPCTSSTLRALPEVHAARVDAGDKVHHYRRAYVEKDRTGQIDGRAFSNPTFSTFAPLFSGLTAARHSTLDVGPSEDAPRPVAEAKARANAKARRDAILDWLGLTFKEMKIDGQTAEAKKARTRIVVTEFRQPTLDQVERMDAVLIEEVVDRLRKGQGLKPRPGWVELDQGDVAKELGERLEIPVALASEAAWDESKGFER